MRKYLRLLGPLAVGSLLSALVVEIISGCLPIKASDREQPLYVQGVPVVRVKLTASPIQSASLAATSGYRLKIDGRTFSSSGGALRPTDVTRLGDVWRIGAASAPGGLLELEPYQGGYASIGNVTYRGSLRLIAVDGDSFIVVNHVDMESYLAGVLPRELYPSWSPVTYRALAVAARTFALYHVKFTGPGRDFDLGAGEASQVYGGFSAETTKAWNAVRDTHGKVMIVKDGAHERLFMTQYSACCGGVVNGAYVIRNVPMVEPFMGGQRCDDCMSCPHYRWDTVTASKAEICSAITAAYPRTAADLSGGLASIRVAESTSYGRAVWLDVRSVNGGLVRLRAEDLRLAMQRTQTPAGRSLYSMNCSINDAGGAIEFRGGRGYGHGVGLCQWGAEGKAKRGWSAGQILSFYYPGVVLMSMY